MSSELSQFTMNEAYSTEYTNTTAAVQ